MTISIPPGTANVVGRDAVPVIKGAVVCLAGAVVAAASFLAVPAAHAVAGCTVPGDYLRLFQPDGGYTLSIKANGSALGPGAVAVIPGGEIGTYGNVSGGIQGRNIDFTITWDNNKGTAHFTGSVGDDGVAHGSATGPSVPINLWNPGPWNSDGALTCEDQSKQGPDVSWDPVPLGGLTVRITDRSGSKTSQCTYRADGYERGFELKAGKTTNLVIFPAIRKYAPWDVTVTCDNGTETRTSIVF